MSIENIEIIESPDNANYVEYVVTHDDGSRGYTDLRIMELDEDHHMHRLLNKGLPSGSKIAEIFFYPHSSTTQHGQGVGSRVLDAVLNDAQERGVRAVYSQVTNTIAERFFRKRGFDKCYELEYYKV